MLKSLFIASLLFSSTMCFANNYDQSLVIDHVEVTRVDTVLTKSAVTLPSAPTNPIDEIAMIIDGLLAIGKKIWPIIEAGKPVINTTGLVPAISVLPNFEPPATRVEMYEMANWSMPKAVSYKISYKNYYGGEVVGFVYTVYFQHSGTYQDKGKYIAGLKVQASQVYAAWGFNFDASSELVNIANVGTKDDPVASAIIQISYKARGLINEMRNAQSFYVDGKGNVQPLNN